MTEAPSGPPMAELSPTYQLADLLLQDQGGLVEFIRTRRADGVPWRKVARDLYDATDHRVDVTHETLRRWLDDEPSAAAS